MFVVISFFDLFRFRLNYRSVWTSLQAVNHAKKKFKTLSEYLRHLTSFHERNYFPLFNVADMTFRVTKTVQISTQRLTFRRFLKYKISDASFVCQFYLKGKQSRILLSDLFLTLINFLPALNDFNVDQIYSQQLWSKVVNVKYIFSSKQSFYDFFMKPFFGGCIWNPIFCYCFKISTPHAIIQ